MPNIGQLGAIGLKKETTLGTFVAPGTFIPFVPPLNFSTEITLLESKGVRSIPDFVYKVAQGPGALKSGKIKFEAEPENGLGEHLMAVFGTDTVTGNGSTTPYTHTFSTAATALPPSYSFWEKNGQNYPEWAGCMCNKLEITSKKGEFVEVDADWKGLKYVSGGVTQSTSYSAHSPFKFNQAALTVGGSGNTNYDNLKLTIDRMTELEWILGSTIYAGKIFSKGFKVTLAADLIVEDTTEWTNFINGTSSSFTITITSSEAITGISPTAYFSLTLTINTVYYNAAPWPLPNGLVRIPFVATAIYTAGSTQTMNAALVNSVSAAY